ncbi:MAG: toprim domain-containing protein, partial [Gammaproteobacteria bacterium]|nr:toprim domain-containing protein [Gammaproteobacteria bacterium]
GEIVGLQATFLDPKTAKKTDLKQNTKLSRGLTSEGALIHQGKPDGVMAYAEGLETALSVADAHPDWNVHLTFGVTNFAKVPLKAESQAVVLCADNDGVDSGTAKTLDKSAQKLAAKGKEVYVALPAKPDNVDKYDFNDLLKNQSKEAVKESLDNRTLYKAAVTAETLKSALSETLEGANVVSEKVESSKHGRENDSPFSPELKAILADYAAMEAKQSAFVRTMHSHMSADKGIYDKASKEAIEHGKAVEAFALTATEQAGIAHALEMRLHFQATSVAEAGGFAAVSDRLATGTVTEKDWCTLLSEMSNKASRARSRSRARDRGGRSQ